MENKTINGLVPPLKDTKAVKAAAEAIDIPVEDFADRFGNLSILFRKTTEDDEHIPNKDFDQVVHRLSAALKVQDVKHISPEDAFLCGAALGWTFAGYIAGEIRYDNR